jgi:hypothetical protein
VVIFIRMAEPTTMTGLMARLTLRALVNPAVALDLIALSWAFRRRGWWQQLPWLPLPDRTYLEWRLHTAYGEERGVPPVDDVVRFARWRRRILRD